MAFIRRHTTTDVLITQTPAPLVRLLGGVRVAVASWICAGLQPPKEC